jgi:hypothetical protein
LQLKGVSEAMSVNWKPVQETETSKDASALNRISIKKNRQIRQTFSNPVGQAFSGRKLSDNRSKTLGAGD